MQALSILSRHVAGLLRMSPLSTPSTRSELGEDYLLWDAKSSVRCGNPVRSWRVLSDWISSRGDKAEDYKWLAAQIYGWGDARLISWLTEARIARLFSFRPS